MNVYHVYGSWDECACSDWYSGTRLSGLSATEVADKWMFMFNYRNCFVVSHGPENLGMTYTFQSRQND